MSIMNKDKVQINVGGTALYVCSTCIFWFTCTQAFGVDPRVCTYIILIFWQRFKSMVSLLDTLFSPHFLYQTHDIEHVWQRRNLLFYRTGYFGSIWN